MWSKWQLSFKDISTAEKKHKRKWKPKQTFSCYYCFTGETDKAESYSLICIMNYKWVSFKSALTDLVSKIVASEDVSPFWKKGKRIHTFHNNIFKSRYNKMEYCLNWLIYNIIQNKNVHGCLFIPVI